MRSHLVAAPRHRVAFAALAALLLAFTAAPGAATAPSMGRPESAVSGGVSVRTQATCGSVFFRLTADPADATLQSRLPLTVSAAEPTRGYPLTVMGTLTAANVAAGISSTMLYLVDPTGRGPGLEVTLEWAGGREAITTEPYVDNCAGDLTPIVPARLLDTRTGAGTADDAPGAVEAGSVTSVDPARTGAVPAEAVTGLVLNVTATEPATAGYLSVYPCGQAPPNASNVNFTAGATVPNLVVVDVVGWRATGSVCVFSSAATHLLVDVTGYFRVGGSTPPGRLNALPSPQRLLNTRTTQKVSSGTVRRVALAGRGGLPTTGVSAVQMNITAVDAEGPGYLTAFPCDTPQPNASNVNFTSGLPVPNGAIVGLNAQGELCIFASATTNVLIDVVGYAAASGGRYVPLAPDRWWDSRLQLPAKLTGEFALTTGYAPGQIITLNVTVVDPDTAGYVSVYPCDQGRPDASNLNFSAGDIVANTVFVRLDASARLCLHSTTPTHFVLDMAGYSTAPVA